MLGLALGRLGDPVDVALGLAPGGRELGALGPLALQLAKALFELGQPALDLVVALGLELVLLLVDLLLDLRQLLVAPVRIDARDDIGGEVDDPLEVLGGDVQQVAETARDALEVPDVGTDAASSMWPIRSRRTLARVTSTPQRSQMMPLKRTRLYLPQ